MENPYETLVGNTTPVNSVKLATDEGFPPILWLSELLSPAASCTKLTIMSHTSVVVLVGTVVLG